MKKAPNPPSDEAVRRAVTLLVEIGALTEDEQLTVLGKRLASLPMDPRTGKMILYGHLFDCLDPLLTITCAISHRQRSQKESNLTGAVRLGHHGCSLRTPMTRSRKSARK